MGHSSHDAVEQGPAWNAGRKFGAKRAAEAARRSDAIRFMGWSRASTSRPALFDLPSTANSRLRSSQGSHRRPRQLGVASESGRWWYSRRPADPSNSSFWSRRESSILAWLKHRGGSVDDFAFPRPDWIRRPPQHQAYARPVGRVGHGDRLHREDYGTHSLRRTKAALIYKATGNLRAAQILLGHTKIEDTAYLGVDVEDALSLAEGTEV